MPDKLDPEENYKVTKKQVGYIELKNAQQSDYQAMGFKCGLEVHQQLKTDRKLFCRCPAGIYQKNGAYDAEIIRHMRPTLSELGEYDGTALMEFKTRKNIIYHIKNITACTYDIDDTPPFKINQQALEIAIEIALISKLNIVGELHITRKQYLDGSIPTGFQRTGIIGIEGAIPLRNKTVRLIQLSIEEDSCREISDIGHYRTYTTDRLGMPLIETVTYPDMNTPDEVSEAAHYIRFLARSTGKVRTGIGAARQDVNVSVTGGTRVEIKGVAHISWIPRLTHNEAFRQKALLEIKKELTDRIKKCNWKIKIKKIDYNLIQTNNKPLINAQENKDKLVAINLPYFSNILSFFTQPGKTFVDELRGRLKVIACLKQPGILHSEQGDFDWLDNAFLTIQKLFKANDNDAQIILWCPEKDLKTAVDTIEERCLLAFEGVPNETRKALTDGTTIFERVLPGPDRMYPDTDSAPIPINENIIEKTKQNLPDEIFAEINLLQKWEVPPDTYEYILKNNLMPVIKKIVNECYQHPIFVVTTFGHTLKHINGSISPLSDGFTFDKVYGLFQYVRDNNLSNDIIKEMLSIIYKQPDIVFDAALSSLDYKILSRKKIISQIDTLKEKFRQKKRTVSPDAKIRWIMGNLRKHVLGSLPLKELRVLIEKELRDG